VLNEQTIQRLYQMKLFTMAESLKERLSRSDHKELSHGELVGLVVDDEWIYRDNRRRKLRQQAAKFKERQATLETIEYTVSRGFKKAELLELAQLDWVRKRQNLILTGMTGVGKSWIAQALGNEACRSGLRVLFIRQPAFIHTLIKAKACGELPTLLKRLQKIDVLIIDDLGVSLMTDEIRRDLLEPIEDRYNVKSTVITSQLPVSEWHDYFGGGRIADALMERLTKCSRRLDLAGPSRRPDINNISIHPEQKPLRAMAPEGDLLSQGKGGVIHKDPID
jgi:DNA replication protein DnaC